MTSAHRGLAPAAARGALATLALLVSAACGASAERDTPEAASGPNPPTAARDEPRSTAPLASTVAPRAMPATAPASALSMERFDVPRGAAPHDVAPAADGGVWYTAQAQGALGHLDPATGTTRQIPLGAGSRPHGVIVDADGAAWVTDGGLNAIVRVDAVTEEVRVFRLPADRPNANLNTATFDAAGRLWFTGQGGIYGRLDPASGAMQVYSAPMGAGPYGITSTADGAVYYSSLAGSYVGRIDARLDGGSPEASVLQPPTPRQGARRAWADARGRVWISEWTAGQVSMYDPSAGAWQEWKLPGERPQAYAVFVDAADDVWLSDFGANALVRFDPDSEQFDVLPLPDRGGNVRQIHGRPGEVWAPESGADAIIVVRYPIDE